METRWTAFSQYRILIPNKGEVTSPLRVIKVGVKERYPLFCKVEYNLPKFTFRKVGLEKWGWGGKPRISLSHTSKTGVLPFEGLQVRIKEFKLTDDIL